MTHDKHVPTSKVVDGAERRYEIVQHESNLFAVTLFEDGQPAGPTDYLKSRAAAEQLGRQWLNLPRPVVEEYDL